MPNWSNTQYIFEGDKKEITSLHKKLQLLDSMEKSLVDNGFGNMWLGNLVTLLGGKWKSILCRGTIDYYNLIDERTLELTTQSAWCSASEVWNFVLKQYTSLEYYFFAEEPGNIIYETNDSTGRYFPERYIVGQVDIDTEYHSLEGELLKDISNRTGVHISSIEQMKEVLKKWNSESEDEENRIWINYIECVDGPTQRHDIENFNIISPKLKIRQYQWFLIAIIKREYHKLSTKNTFKYLKLWKLSN